ncbi:MAG: ABC transporter ATP-binding protein [Deltaproteobacteria bacterium]|nr:ABC transporter ATP-binding protein [Deltaproteobacteria bacterium]
MSSLPNSPYSSGLEHEGATPFPAPARTPLISYRGVYKSFNDKQVLEGIDLDIYEGETLVILGRSGSGKTVMTSILVGLVQPDTGVVTVAGVDLSTLTTDYDWLELRLKTGYLFQGSALYDSMTVGENVAFPMVQHTNWSMEEISRRVHEKLAQVGLADTENLEPSALSGGMQRRAALARTLALDPQIIIYDEPTAGLDPITGDEIAHLIRRLQQTLSVTSIVVTHDLRLTETVADRLALLYQGVMVFLGTFEEFMKSDHPEVRRFLHYEIQEDKS